MTTATKSKRAWTRARDTESVTELTAPITLRELEAASISLDSTFGTDDAEHDELLDDATLLRIVVSIGLKDGLSVSEDCLIECLQGVIRRPEGHWAGCVAWCFHHAAGHKNRLENGAIRRMIEDLIGEEPELFQTVRDEWSECAEASSETK